jgi:hypothetical protein
MLPAAPGFDIDSGIYHTCFSPGPHAEERMARDDVPRSGEVTIDQGDKTYFAH